MTVWSDLKQGDGETVKMGWMMNEVESVKKVALTMVLATLGAGTAAWAQTPAAPEMSPATAQAQQSTVPQAPAAKAPVDPFPPVNLKNFTASSPTTAEVNTFLKAAWGYNENRIWSVAAIEKTAAPGVTRVVVFAADKSQPGKVSRNEFFVTPDGKHAIAGGVVDFGTHPFDARRTLMQEQANGPAEGATSKGLMLVIFSDLLNDRSKEAQDSLNNLMSDIPQARIVFEELPADGSPYALHTAEEGVCVRKAKGDAAFYIFAQTMFSKLKGLTATTLQPAIDAAVTAAGADPKSVDACAATPAAKASVEASIALAGTAGVDAAPTLVANGRILPLTNIPYDTLKRIIAYQAQLDGIPVHVQPTLSNLK
ncbi:MAG: thioredoxin domain-containing protein [Acidobacteriaceae bacterium]